MIDVKVVTLPGFAPRFVTCFPMPELKPEQVAALSFGQKVVSTRKAKEMRQRMSGPADSTGLLGYMLTKHDQEHGT